MRKNVLLLGSMAVAVLLACGTALSGAAGPVEAAEPQGVLDAACPENPVPRTELGRGDLPGLASGNPWAQTFTTIRTGELTSAQVLIQDGSPATPGGGDVVIQIRAVDASGVPTNTVLASTVVPATELVADPGSLFGLFIPVAANFGLDGAASVVAGQRYALYVTTSGTPDYYMVVINPNNPCEGTLYGETSQGFVNAGPLGGDASGNPEGDLVFATYVTLTPDTTPPRVISTSPKANANEVAPTANVRATFSEEMDSNTIDGQTFKLFEKGSTTQIPGTVSYNSDTDTAKLDPTDNLRRGVAYKAVVTTWARDVAGNRLDQDGSASGLQQMRWFFRVDD